MEERIKQLLEDYKKRLEASKKFNYSSYEEASWHQGHASMLESTIDDLEEILKGF
jgi:DNA-binding ferritin-like protein (Dps family)